MQPRTKKQQGCFEFPQGLSWVRVQRLAAPHTFGIGKLVNVVIETLLVCFPWDGVSPVSLC